MGLVKLAVLTYFDSKLSGVASQVAIAKGFTSVIPRHLLSQPHIGELLLLPVMTEVFIIRPQHFEVNMDTISPLTLLLDSTELRFN